jgi:nitrate reductase alpha subunit
MSRWASHAEGRVKMIPRRDFLKIAGGSVAAAAAGLLTNQLAFLQTVPEIANPLAAYPGRDWEKAYRALNQYDSEFAFLCAPNDTHNCLLMAKVRAGVIARIEPSYKYGQATDVYGNQASHRWEPRACQKGIGLTRRFYGDRRVKGAYVRRGYLAWAEAGYPRDAATGLPEARYFQRGKDEFVKVSYDRAYELVARAMVDIATAYTGPDGAERLKRQGYDEAVIGSLEGAGVRTLKFRGGMPFLGATRVWGLYRFANAMALLDAKLRNLPPERAVGARGWDNYAWHTDLPPGHTLVTGQQTVDFDLFTAENAKLITIWGMNWLTTKMPDGHWLTEARLRGARVIVIATEYQATANKADEVIVIRPGTDAALALGVARQIIDEQRYDARFVKNFTDLPLLVRLDTLKLVSAADVIPNYQLAALSNFTRVLKPGEAPAPIAQQNAVQLPEAMRNAWGDYVVWDTRANQPQPVSRDQVGQHFDALGIDPALEGTFTLRTVDGKTVEARPVFALVRDYLREFDLQTVSELTWAPVSAITSLAKQLSESQGAALIAHGMGGNHFFNADLKDRALFLISSLTRNIGFLGGTPGSFAGNYRAGLFGGLPQYVVEDPFQPELDPQRPPRTRSYYKAESAHYFNYGDRPLRVGNKLFTGKSHLPSPSKFIWVANSNSLIGNAKWSYDLIHNTLPRVETLVVNEWWWTMSCEYADIVFGVDSWAEFKHPDMAGSVTNPFVSIYPRSPLPRIFETVADIETYAGVGRALATVTGERRFADLWHFVGTGQVDVYLQRIIDGSNTLRGYLIAELEAKAKQGVPALMLARTYPRVMGWEQTQESRPWYTRTGRLEFYRDEDEFIEYGENLPVYREPVDATPHEPNVILSRPHPALKPSPPAAYGLRPEDQRVEVRQVRNVVMTWAELKASRHPRRADGLTHLFITPKYRHGAHTFQVDSDTSAMFFGPFGDAYRHDKRMPYTNEGYVDINPADARALGVQDGDYVWIDADPEDRPYRGWKPDDPDYKVMRLLCRARYYAGTPKGVLRMWFNMYQATHGTVEGQQQRPDGLAKNPRTGYQAMFRSGGHQSATRAWLRPTLMTDSFYRKDYFGQVIGQGFAADVYCTVGAPKESFVKVTRAEAGGGSGAGLWRPAQLGFRPTYENAAMKQFLAGGFVTGAR